MVRVFLLGKFEVSRTNHATQHRRELAVMLTQFGYSPGWLDLLYFIDLQS